MQSDLDGKVADHFTTLLGRSLTQAGKPKAGSALEIAEAGAQAAELAYTEASERLTRLLQAVNDVEAATQASALAERDLVALAADHVVVSDKRERASLLEQQLEREERLAREATTRLENLLQAQARIAQLHVLGRPRARDARHAEELERDFGSYGGSDVRR